MLTWVNGHAVESITVRDRGLQFGDGVFETCVFRQGKFLRIEAHLRRLQAGAERLLIAPPMTEIRADLTAIAAQLPDPCVVKLILTRGASERGYRLPQHAQCHRVITVSVLPDFSSQAQGITVRICQLQLASQPALAGLKHLNRLEQVLARAEWDDPQIAEGLMLDTSQHLIEGTMSNLFLVAESTLITPKLDQCGVAGVMRQTILAHAQQQQIPWVETAVTLEDLLRAEEVFVCNSVIGIWPVLELTDPRHTWPLGAITQRLHAELVA